MTIIELLHSVGIRRKARLPGTILEFPQRVAPRGRPRSQQAVAEAPDLLVVLHPGSTRFAAGMLRAAVESACLERGLRHRVVEIPDSRGGDGVVRRQIARAIREGCTRIVAAGGDGTVGLVAQSLARRRETAPRISLGIIPAGTTNVLAHELGIPMDLGRAIAVIVEADHAIDVDAMLVGRRYVLTQVGVGPDALMIRHTSRQGQEKLGRVAYMVTFLRRAARFRSRPFTLKVDGQVTRERAWQIVVANAGSLGSPPFTWGPHIDPTDGALDLCVFNVHRPHDFGKILWRLLRNRHQKDKNTRFYRVHDRVHLDTGRSVLVQGDGEIIGRTPVTVRLIPSAVRILVAKAVEGTLPADAPPQEPPPSPTPATVGGEMERMIAQRSRAWALQGPMSHPLAAMEALDAAVFLRLNSVSLGAFWDWALEAISRFLHYGEGWVVGVLVLLLFDLTKGVRVALAVLPALWFTMITVNVVLKRAFRRRRPFIAFVDARVIGPRPRDFSFPSGHTAAGFAGALLMSLYVPAGAPLFYVFALAVGFSRIYLGVHYPSDVLMGAFSGTVLALAYHAVIRLLLGG